MVTSVRGVDGDEGEVPQILTAFELRLLGGFGLGEHGFRETIGDAVGMDRNEARHLLRRRIAEPLDNAGGLHAHARGARNLEAHQLAIFGISGGTPRHGPFFQLLALDRIDDARASRKRAENAEQASCGLRQALDGPRLIGVIGIGAEGGDPRQHAVADAGDGARLAFALGHEDAGRSAMLLVPHRGSGDEFAVGVAAGDLDHRHRRQDARPRQLAARARDQPVIGHVAQERFQRDPVAALDPEGARDLALAGLTGCGGEKVDNVLLGRKFAHSLVARSPLRFCHGRRSACRLLDGLFVALSAFTRRLLGRLLLGRAFGASARRSARRPRQG